MEAHLAKSLELFQEYLDMVSDDDFYKEYLEISKSTTSTITVDELFMYYTVEQLLLNGYTKTDSYFETMPTITGSLKEHERLDLKYGSITYFRMIDYTWHGFTKNEVKGYVIEPILP